MDYNLEYYRIVRENNNSYPLLIVTKGRKYQNTAHPQFIEMAETMEYRLGNPVPAKPVMADYHSTPNSVISNKIADILLNMNITGVQLIPAVITGKDDELYDNYFYLNIFNVILALDKEKSVYKWDDFLEEANPIKKIVLDYNVLEKIPLEERLVFLLGENKQFRLFHKSVVDAITEVNPEGVQFVKVEDWDTSTPFK